MAEWSGAQSSILHVDTPVLVQQHTVARAWPASLVTAGDLVVVAGGRDANGVALDSMEFFVPSSNIWTVGRSRLIIPRWGASMALLPDGRFAIAGGCDPEAFLDSIEIYDSSYQNRGWKLMPSLMFFPRALFAMSVSVIPGPICASNNASYYWSTEPKCVACTYLIQVTVILPVF